MKRLASQYQLPEVFVSRLKEYIESDSFGDVTDVSASDYWKYHLSQMNVDIKGNTVTIGAISGHYIPVQTSEIKGILPLPKCIIDWRKFWGFMRQGYSCLNITEAFDHVMNHDRIADIYLAPDRINFQRLRQKPAVRKSVADIQKRFFAKDKYRLSPSLQRNEHMIRAYYYFNIIMGLCELPKKPVVLEIGAGNGNLTSILYQELQDATMVICDLPKTVCISAVFIRDLFPDAKICLPHEFSPEIELRDYDFVFVTPQQSKLFSDSSFDLCTNTASFHEMNREQIVEYIHLIQRITKHGGYFFNTNRVEKIPSVSDTSDFDFLSKEVTTPVNRYADYGWYPENEIMAYEVCRLIRMAHLDDYFIRLERIRKQTQGEPL
ncbi:MAG: putative sugar O-methyltransferase [Candidatus Omnitrophica bacterium]|nr:putative sugar O-methyltransferase [Candidatus Omnitrophota bacterium]